MRSYHVAAASVALSCQPKWLDNVLSKYDIPGVERSRQGVSRRLSFDALVLLATVRLLGERFGIPISRALELASEVAANADGWCADAGICGIRVDVARIREDLTARVRAAELSAPTRRGRPPARRRAND